MAQLTGRQDAPVLLLTKLHPPFVAAETITRERLFERLSAGRDRRLSLVACPAGFGKSTLVAAWREREAERRPVAWVTLDEGDDDPVVLWSHVIEALGRACPELAGELGAEAAAAAPLLEVVLPRLVNALARAGRGRARARRLPPALERLGARQRRVVRRPPAGERAARALHPRRPGAAAGRPARPRRAAGAAGERPALHGRGGRRVPQRPARARARAGRPRAPGRAHRGLAGRHLPGGALAGRAPGQARARRRVRRHQRPRRRLPLRARCSPPSTPTCRRSCCAPRCSSGCAARCARRCSASPSPPARSSRSRAPTSSCCRSTTSGSGSASTTCSPSSCAWSSSGASRRSCGTLHRRAYEWHVELGTTEEAIQHAVAAGAFGEAGQLIAETWVHYVNAGRTSSVLDWLLRFPAELLDADRRLLLVRAWVSALRGDEAGMRARAGARARARPPRRRPVARRLRLARVQRLGAERGVRVGRRRRGARARARARSGSRGPTRRGARSSPGRSAGRTTAAATSTPRSAGCGRRPSARPRPSSGSSAPARSPTCR